MLLLGITGSINHGKSTLAAALAGQAPTRSRHLTSFELIASVADELHRSTQAIPSSSDIEAINEWLEALPPILAEKTHVHCSIKQISFTAGDVKKNPEEYSKLLAYLDHLQDNPTLLHQKIDESNVESYRSLLQWLGGYLVAKVDPGIWYEELIRQTKEIEQQGTELCIVDGLRYLNDAKLIKEAGGEIVEISRPSVAVRDTSDPTERQQQSIKPDITIVNDGTVKELRIVAAKVFSDIRESKQKSTYHCAKS